VSLSRNDVDSAHRTAAIIAAPGPLGVLIHSGPLVLFGVYLTPDDANEGRINLFDNTAASGDSISYITPVSTSTKQQWEPKGIYYSTGLYVTRTTLQAGWTAVITYLAE